MGILNGFIEDMNIYITILSFLKNTPGMYVFLKEQ